MKQLTSNTISPVEVFDEVNPTEIILQKSLGNSGRDDDEDGFFICDLGDIVLKHKKWQEIFPGIHPHYAIKCNPNDAMLRCMIAMGTGFDCASKAEISQMLRLGARPEDIIFANPCKQSSHIKFARDHGITDMVFDNEIELQKIKKIFPDANLVLRIQTDDSASICRFSMKYGAHPDSCKHLLDVAKMLGLRVIGVSFHVGSGCQDPLAYVKALRLARDVFEYSKVIGFDFNLLDIGGGFPGTDGVKVTTEEIASSVMDALEDLFPRDRFKSLNVIAEPGRYYAASAFTLATNVIAKRKVCRDKQSYHDETASKGAILNAAKPSKCDEPAFMYFLNDGLYGSFNCLFYDHAEVKPSLLKTAKRDEIEFASSIWGPTCDGLDRILQSCMLPELNTGDWIIWNDMGAYTVAAGSAFNGFKTTVVYYVISSENKRLLEKMCDYDRIPEFTFRSVCTAQDSLGRLHLDDAIEDSDPCDHSSAVV